MNACKNNDGCDTCHERGGSVSVGCYTPGAEDKVDEMQDGEYYISYSHAKTGWCVFQYSEKLASRGPKVAGPYRAEIDAKTECDRLNDEMYGL